jgi:hypothetical protein
MRGAIPPLLNTPSRRGVELKKANYLSDTYKHEACQRFSAGESASTTVKSPDAVTFPVILFAPVELRILHCPIHSQNTVNNICKK